ncbi:MAG: bifunctional folylpolyglutamate synthase/dihydrofolate synthase [Candidatus Flexifilum sp.]
MIQPDAVSDPALRAYLAALDRLIQPIPAAALPTDLEPLRALLAALGDPQRHVRAIAIAGSTGKGSTAWRLAHQLPGRIGLYLSPHLHSFRERIRLAGNPIPRDDFSALAERVRAAADRTGVTPSTFEATTALAYLYFAEQRVDRAVMEIGLGGRFDAVNVAAAPLALIAPIELEHAAMLGGTLEAIAWHKAGIIPPGGIALTVPQDPVVQGVLEAEARRQHAHLLITDDLAAAAHAVLGSVPIARAAPPFPGRLEPVERQRNGLQQTIVIDGGHTPGAARYVRARALADAPTGRVLIGMLRDKDAAGFLHEFDRPGWTVELVSLPGARGLDAHELAAAYAFRAARPEVGTSVEAGLDRAEEPLIVVTGSLRLAAAAREHLGLLDADLLAEARATRALFDGPSYRQRLSGGTESR